MCRSGPQRRMIAHRRIATESILNAHMKHAGARSADSGGSHGSHDQLDELVVVGTWHILQDAADTEPGRESGRYLDHRRRPVTRSQSSSSAETPSAARRSPAQAAAAQKLCSADALFFVTAHAPADGSARRRTTPAISVCHSDGAPTASETRLKVILYPLPRPGRGYLALRCPVPVADGTRAAAAADAARRADAVPHVGLCGGATAAGDSSAAASGIASSSGQQAERGSASPGGEAAARQTRLESVLMHVNCAAYALAVLRGSARTQSHVTHSSWVDVVTKMLCSAAVGAGDVGAVQPEAGDVPPHGAGQRLLQLTLRSSAFLKEVCRRGAMLRKGALPLSCFGVIILVITVP